MTGRGIYMEYPLEELLPLTAWLADKYTSKESSSVTYETAQMLMEAVLYCVREYENITAGALRSEHAVKAEDAYKIGYDRVVKKVHKAKEIYNDLTGDFCDYGCSNYRGTLLEGMPAFFIAYDARFRPQDHLLTLDYPTVNFPGEMCGINIIYQYLCDIVVEKGLLECFPEQAVTRLLRQVQSRIGTSYMGNLSEMVLVTAFGCMIADRRLMELSLSDQDIEAAEQYFSGDNLQKTEGKLKTLLRILAERSGRQEWVPYFDSLCHEYAVRIQNGIKYGTLETVFLGA